MRKIFSLFAAILFAGSMMATTYTVAGNSDVAFGTTWAPANTANDMVLIEGIYTWEKSELTLAAGNIEFKVCEDHAWTNCWPSENYQLNIPEAGIYTVTITFNAETKEVAAVATKTGEAVIIVTSVAMHGNFLGSWADTENFTIAQDNASASLTLALTAGNYEFGMRCGGSGNWTANGAAFNRENASHVILPGSGNLTLAADVAGDYTFTWTYASNTLTITFPEKPIDPEQQGTIIFEWTKGTGAKIEADNTDLNANGMGVMTVGTSVVARLYGENQIDNNAKGYKLGNNDVCVQIQGSSAFAVGDTVIITGVCGGSGLRAFAIAPSTTTNATVDTALTNTQENTSEILEYRVIVKEAQAGEKMNVFRMAGKTMYLYSIKVVRPAGAPEPPVVPTAAVTGDMTEWGEPIPFELSEDSTFAMLYNDNIKKGTYEFKMIINGDWRSNGYEFHRGFPGCAGITGNTEANMTIIIDVEGAYTFKWYFANDSLAIIYPEKPEPVLANGYYMVGKFDGVDAWDPVAENLFAANPDAEGEYQLAIDLAINDEVKVVYVEDDAIVTWFPAEGGNYIIDDHHNGETTMYFRPDYQGGDGWFAGCIYVIPTSTVGFENTTVDSKAVKSLQNGILVIEKNNKLYNVIGQMLK